MYKRPRQTQLQRIAAMAPLLGLIALVTSAPAALPQGSASGFGSLRDSQRSYAILASLAADSVKLDNNLGRNRLRISDKVVVYDFSPAADAMLTSRPDRLTSPLEILIRADVLDRDFHTYLPAQVFWVGPVAQLRTVAAKEVDEAFKAASDEQWNSEKQEYEAQTQAAVGVLEKGLLAYAAKAGLDVRSARGPVQGFLVQVRIEPKGHVKYMRYLDYKKCMAHIADFEDYWVDLEAGTQQLIGKYHYLAEWPPSLSKPYEGDIDINADGIVLAFEPRGK